MLRHQAVKTCTMDNKRFCDIREESKFIAQVAITIIVIIASIVNLSIGTEDKVLWVSLLSSCVGLAFPGLNTERKRKENNSTSDFGDCIDGRQPIVNGRKS